MHKKIACAMFLVYSVLLVGFVMFYPAYEKMNKQIIEHIFLIRSLCFAGNLVACCLYFKGKHLLATTLTVGIGCYLFLGPYNRNFLISFWDSMIFTSIFLISNLKDRVRHAP